MPGQWWNGVADVLPEGLGGSARGERPPAKDTLPAQETQQTRPMQPRKPKLSSSGHGEFWRKRDQGTAKLGDMGSEEQPLLQAKSVG